MTKTLLFYTISERFGDDERLIANFIYEKKKISLPYNIYNDLLHGRFDKYAIILKEITDDISDDELAKWCKKTKYNFIFQRDKWGKTDFERLEADEL